MANRAWTLLLLVMGATLAGCVGDDSANDGSGADDDSGPGGGDGGDQDEGEREGEGEAPPLLEDPVEVTFYLDADGSLVRELPAAGYFEQGSFVTDYFQGKVDADALSQRSRPLANATFVHEQPVRFTLWAQSDVPHPPLPGFDSVGAIGFFGSTKGMPRYTMNGVDPVFLPGEPTRYEVLIESEDLLPIVIPVGERISLMGALGATTTDEAPARILVGGEHASSITFTMSNLTRDPLEGLGAASAQAFTGTIQSNQDPRPAHTFTLDGNATELQVEVRLAGGNEADLDIDLFDAEGKRLSGSHTPATYESIYLMGPALEGLGGTTLTVEVGHFHPVNAQYEVTVSQR